MILNSKLKFFHHISIHCALLFNPYALKYRLMYIIMFSNCTFLSRHSCPRLFFLLRLDSSCQVCLSVFVLSALRGPCRVCLKVGTLLWRHAPRIEWTTSQHTSVLKCSTPLCLRLHLVCHPRSSPTSSFSPLPFKRIKQTHLRSFSSSRPRITSSPTWPSSTSSCICPSTTSASTTPPKRMPRSTTNPSPTWHRSSRIRGFRRRGAQDATGLCEGIWCV